MHRSSLRSFAILALGALALAGCTADAEDAAVAPLPACSTPADPASLPPLPASLPTYVNTLHVQGPAATFQHGVASGDPTQTDVILWTRVTTDAASPAVVPVFYEVALDEAFTSRVAAAEVTTSAAVDYTVKVDVKGLTWGRDYFYRFQALGRTSPVGRTRLAPAAAQAACLRFAVVSCASYAHGYFYGYRHVAERKDIDAVLHLGDYIYEYESGGYGDVRAYEPANELLTLADYRARYAQYRRDPDLQALHLAHPMISTWDDHETADNSYASGANNHQDNEGDWEARKGAGRQAYFEWLPIRETPGRRLWRSFQYGDLADLVFLDTRIAGRDAQLGAPEDDTPEHHLLDTAQETWLGTTLAAGKARWEVIAQQVMVAPMYVGEGPFNMDQWDGYSHARDRLYDMLEKEDENVVVLTGDIHSSWAFDLTRDPFAKDYNPARDNLAVEFVVPGITSPGFPEGSEDLLGPQIDKSNPHLRWRNLEQRGYMVLDIDRNRVQADWFLLDGVLEDQGHESFAKGWVTAWGEAMLREAPAPVERPAASR
jgi:alkaline phosphatase D